MPKKYEAKKKAELLAKLIAARDPDVVEWENGTIRLPLHEQVKLRDRLKEEFDGGKDIAAMAPQGEPMKTQRAEIYNEWDNEIWVYEDDKEYLPTVLLYRHIWSYLWCQHQYRGILKKRRATDSEILKYINVSSKGEDVERPSAFSAVVRVGEDGPIIEKPAKPVGKIPAEPLVELQLNLFDVLYKRGLSEEPKPKKKECYKTISDIIFAFCYIKKDWKAVQQAILRRLRL